MPDLTQVTSPSGARFTVAKDAADAFSGFLTDLEKTGYKIDPASSGGYNPRNIAGTDTPSQHAFGHAIDINPGSNPRGAKGPSDLPANVADLAAAHGLTWGGGWSGDTRDPMHFELSGKPVAEAAAPSVDDLRGRIDALRAKAAPAAPGGDAAAPGEAEAPSVDDLKARISALPRPSAPPQAPVKSGYAANVGAGALEGVAGSINLATDPASSFLSMLKVPNLLIAAHDALAGTTVGKALGADKPFTPEAKNYLLGADTTPGAFGSQPDQGYGSNLVHMLGTAAGVQPEDITAATPGQRIAREAATGATMGAFTGNLLAVPAGAAGSIGASELPRMLPKDTPELLKALAELPAGVLSALAVGGAGAGAARFAGPTARATGNALTRPVTATAEALDRFARGADEPPPPEATPPAGTPPEGPTPAGAMVTPPQLATFTPAETAAYRASAEGRKLMENQEIGVPDRNAYIPGVTVSAAEQELTAGLARELKSAGLESPEVSQDIKATAQRNDQLRRSHLQDTTGDEVSVHNEETAQNADIEADKPKVFGADNVQGPVSTEPLIKQIDDTRNGPENRQNPELQKVLGDLRERLTNPDGSPRQMSPQEAWGLRRSIDRQTSKRMAADDPALHFEGHQLRTITDTLDGEIEKVAPGYADMVNTYRSHAQKIEAMRILQEKTRGMLSQTTTPMRFSDFQRFMKNVVDMRKTPSTDLNPYKSITDEQMSRLWNVRDDLRRVATASELARAPGSDTVPNIMDMLKRHVGDVAMHGVANYISPGLGSLAVNLAKQGMANRNAARAATQMRARAHQLLNPPNQLIDPNAPP
jgi:hypothetical protein